MTTLLTAKELIAVARTLPDDAPVCLVLPGAVIHTDKDNASDELVYQITAQTAFRFKGAVPENWDGKMPDEPHNVLYLEMPEDQVNALLEHRRHGHDYIVQEREFEVDDFNAMKAIVALVKVAKAAREADRATVAACGTTPDYRKIADARRVYWEAMDKLFAAVEEFGPGLTDLAKD